MAKRYESNYIRMRKFHSFVKGSLLYNSTNLIKKNKKNVSLFDISVGRMGDYHNWNKAGINYVFGIDPDKESIDEAKLRLENIKENDTNKTNVDLKIATITDDNFNIRFPNGHTKFDIVSCQFSLHYFFKNQKMLDNALSRIVNRLNPGGYFIGTTINGDKLNSILQNTSKIETPFYSIEKKYKKYEAFGSKYEFILHDIEQSGNYFDKISTEFLVSPNVLIQACNHHGLILKQIKSFDKYLNTKYLNTKYPLLDYESNISFLYFSFVFQKPYVKKNKKIKKNN